MRIVGIIPARWGSTRLPGKPLQDLNGRPLIEHVWRKAVKAKSISRLIVATDDQRIFDTVLKFGGEAVMTPVTCASGTDRLALVARKITCDVVINIQGDEPFLPSVYLERLVSPFLHDKHLQMSTLAAPLPARDINDPNAVKVVCDQSGNALYFSRAPIPYGCIDDMSSQKAQPRLHLGLYAYRRSFLLQFAKLPQTPLEQREKLEQLRVLENGFKIKVVQVSKPLLSIDTPADLARARKMTKTKR